MSRLCKESISPETVGSILQVIADLLATATSETEYNIIRFWKETLQQYRFLYDIQQRNVDDHSNVILQLMARSMVDVPRSITAPIALAQSQPQVTVQESKDLKEIIARLNERLDEHFVTVNTVTGDKGIKHVQAECKRTRSIC